MIRILFVFFLSISCMSGEFKNTSELVKCLTNKESAAKYVTIIDTIQQKIILLRKFSKFEDIYFNCRYYVNGFNSIYIVPKSLSPLILDSSFDAEKIIPLFDKFYFVFFSNLKGIELFEETHRKNPILAEILFYFTQLDLYINGIKAENQDCSIEMFKEKTSFMHPYYYLTFIGVIYPKQGICPLIFRNANVIIIKFSGISNSFLNINILKFQEIRNNNSKEVLMKNFRYLNLMVYNEILSSDLLNFDLFSNI